MYLHVYIKTLPETPRDSQRLPETPRDSQRLPETPRDSQRLPDTPHSALSANFPRWILPFRACTGKPRTAPKLFRISGGRRRWQASNMI